MTLEAMPLMSSRADIQDVHKPFTAVTTLAISKTPGLNRNNPRDFLLLCGEASETFVKVAFVHLIEQQRCTTARTAPGKGFADSFQAMYLAAHPLVCSDRDANSAADSSVQVEDDDSEEDIFTQRFNSRGSSQRIMSSGSSSDSGPSESDCGSDDDDIN